MTVTQVAPLHRKIFVVLLVVAVITSVVEVITGVPKLVAADFSFSAVLSGIYLLGRVVLNVLWTVWIVWLARGTTAQVDVPGSGMVRVVQPRRTEQASGVAPEQVTVHTIWKWSWVRATGAAVQLNGEEIPRLKRVTFGVMGPRQHAEDAAAWLRSALQTAHG